MATIYKTAIENIEKIINEARSQAFSRHHELESMARAELQTIKGRWWYKFHTTVEFKLNYWQQRIVRSWKNAFAKRYD